MIKRFIKPLKVLEVIIIVVVTLTVATTLPLAKNCVIPRCYAKDALDANALSDIHSDRYLLSCSVQYEGVPV